MISIQRMFPCVSRTHLAIAVACAMHAGLAAWAMQPVAPAVLPPQPVLQIVMLAEPMPQPPAAAPHSSLASKQLPVKTAMKPHLTSPTPKMPTSPEPKRVSAPQPQDPSSVETIAAPAMPEAAVPIQPPSATAAYLRNPPPSYPAAARRRHMEGKVLLTVRVTRDGAAEKVSIARSSGFDVLDEAARAAVEQWRFVPARRGGEAFAASVTVPVIFRMTNGA